MKATTFARQKDLRETARGWRLWTFLSWQDVRQRYRGSVLGPFWIAGSVLVLTLGAGSLYSAMFEMDATRLLPYISLSVSLWLFISLTISESSAAFLNGSLIIRNTALPLGLHIFRIVSRNLIVLAHNAPVVVAVFLLYGFAPSGLSPLAVPGFLLLVLNVSWMAWLAALVSTRFRDAGQLIAFGLQFAIFVTPIFWFPEQSGERHVVLVLNPFHHLLQVARGPIVGDMPSMENWLISIIMAAAGWAAAIWAHSRFRNAVVHWL